jgi:hypothetical protein
MEEAVNRSRRTHSLRKESKKKRKEKIDEIYLQKFVCADSSVIRAFTPEDELVSGLRKDEMSQFRSPSL